MPVFSGELRKMQAALPADEKDAVQYQMVLGEKRIDLNDFIGDNLTLSYSGEINCVHCSRKTNKSFNQGYCYPCFKSLAQCDQCIMSPEKCHYEAGTCREPSWGETFCLQDHYVYLANSSGLKVGITRGTQIPTRWIDQGAVQALPIFRVQQRRYAGLVEVILKQHMADKTNWRAMLKGNPELLDLPTLFRDVLPEIKTEIEQLQNQYGLQSIQLCEDVKPIAIKFPVSEFPLKVTSRNFDKTPTIDGKLLGIKGQYLILDTGVLNLRKFGGYHITLSV